MPATQYAQSGELSVAYQCVGDGPLDLLFIPGFVSNVELLWDIPKWVRLCGRVAALLQIMALSWGLCGVTGLEGPGRRDK